MKKLFVLGMITLAIGFAGCSKDEGAKDKSYTIVNNSYYDGTSVDRYLDGSIYDVVIYEYKGDEIVRQQSIDKVASGSKSGLLRADAKSDKVKVSFMMLPRESPNYNLSFNTRKYIVSFTYLEEGKNVDVVLDNNTMVGNSLSSKTRSGEKTYWEFMTAVE